ncbi:MAG: sugar phosphate isomerase/epimerase family protein [Planctomycetota bacterium]
MSALELPSSLASRLGVCSWSLLADDSATLVERVHATGLSRVQLSMTPVFDDPRKWADVFDRLKREGIEVVSGMISPYGEDYASLASIRATGGVLPDGMWERNLAMCEGVADLAKEHGVKTLTFHAGFVPHDPQDPTFGKVRDRLAVIAGLCVERGVDLLLETGQETAADLTVFLDAVDAAMGVVDSSFDVDVDVDVGEGVGVNFDPANMLLYGKGDPIAALTQLMPRVRQVHLKDAIASGQAETWGSEEVVGTGQVDWPAFVGVLNDAGYDGELVIEREAGEARVDDVRAAAEHIARLWPEVSA